MSLINSASPQVILLGADDQSTRTISPSVTPTPQHLPLFHIFAKKGTTDRMVLTASEMLSLYGDETFEVNEKWFNHQTRFLVAMQGHNNICMVQRLIPKDAGAKSNANIYLDIIEADLPNYLRSSAGAYILNSETGKYKVDPDTPTVPGYRVKLVKEYVDTDVDPGSLLPKTGTMKITKGIPSKVNAKYVSMAVNNIKNKIKVTDVITLDIDTDADDLTIESDNDNITIDGDGNITAVKAGNATITITGSKAGYTNTVITHQFTIVAEDQTVKPTATIELQEYVDKLTHDVTTTTIANTDTSVTLNITSSVDTVATVANGVVTAVGPGQTILNITIPYTDSTESIKSYIAIQYDDATYTYEITESKMYPIFEIKAKYQGEYYNNIGFTINSLYNDSVDSKIVSETKSIPFSLSLYTRTDSKSSPTTLRSLYGEPSVNFSFKENAINPNTEAKMDFETVFENNWFNETDTLKTLRYSEYENFYLYRENYETVVKKLLESEKQYVSTEVKTWGDNESGASSTWYDFTTDDQTEIDSEYYIMNPFAFKTSKNVPYFTVMKAEGDDTLEAIYSGTQREVVFSSDAPIFLEGGTDGTFTNEEFEELVVEKMAEYADSETNVHDLAINVESIYYDTGYTLETKKELVNFIALRKDTALVLSTHDATLGDKQASLSDSRAIGEALKTRCQLAPESEYFGTPVVRAIILVGTGKLRDGSTNNRIPLSYEIANKSAKMMGSNTGKWKYEELFDKYPNNTLTYLTDPQPAFIPEGIKPTLWSSGLVWCQPYDRTSYFFPALQTVYDDDTSVLNSYFNMMAMCQLSKLGALVWRRHTGTTMLTSSEFKEVVTADMNELLRDKFAGLIKVVATCEITEEDEQRGYSFRLIYKLYGNVPRTVGIVWSEIYRASDLAE